MSRCNFPGRAAACAVALAAFGSPGPATAAEDEVLDAQRIFEQLAGRSAQMSATRGIAAEATPAPFATAALPAIRFEHDSAALTEEAVRQLRELGAALRMMPLDGARFAVQGHTDSLGAAAYNRGLSLRRARSATRYLVDAGIAAGRLTAVGLGEDMPLPGKVDDDPRNRRVEIISLGVWRPSVPADTVALEDRALLIGIDDYRHVSDLMGAPVRDVNAMREYVRDRLGYPETGIRTLLNGEATRENILAAIRDWLIVPGAGRTFLYFSGHGFRQPDADGDEADGFDETLVPVDVSVEGSAARGMITDDEVAALLARMADRQVDVVIDACHSGTLTRSAADVPDWRYVKSPRLPDGAQLRPAGATRGFDAAPEITETFVESAPPGLTVWAAVRADQKALVDAESGTQFSVFTNCLLAGARDSQADSDGDGAVTAQELLRYLRDESEGYCKRHAAFCVNGLTPQLEMADAAVDAPGFAGPATLSAPAPRIHALAKDILVSPVDAAESDSGGVTLRLEPGPVLQLGEEIKIVVESGRTGALVLLDVDADGQLTQVFPNEHSLRGGASRFVGAGETVKLPGPAGGFRFRARPPAGRGLLVAVVADDALRLASLTGRHKDLAVIERPDAFLVELAGHLRRWSGESGWSYGELAYEIAGE